MRLAMNTSLMIGPPKQLKKEYLINKKKVYRLMKENNLLLGTMIRPTGKREYVKFRRIKATKPLEYL
jgi:putative transposase